MKFKNCSEEKQLKLRKPSVKRMHRPKKFEAMLRGKEKYCQLLGLKEINII